tara:strand:- start:1792 stop:2670 length:879 start_codon:yes stop_codon:yes gene_type:complete
MNKIIVVTGGAGFVGSNLIEFLISKTNYNIISLDNYSTGTKKNHLQDKRIKYIRGNTVEIQKLLCKYKNKIIVIFHFGEFSRIHQSFLNKKDCFDSNLSGSLQVFLFAIENKIKVIYSATSASLGNRGNDENLSPYAFTKSKNLKLLIQLKKWFNLSYEALYFYNVYGPRQIDSGPMATVIGIFQKQFSNKQPLTVVKPGTQTRKFTHVKDTVEGCYYAWKKNMNRHYAISNAISYSILNIASIFGSKIKFIKAKLGERYSSAAVSKIGDIKIFKIKCSKNLKSYIDEYKKK